MPAGVLVIQDLIWHEDEAVDVVLAHHEGHLQNDLHHQLAQVAEQQRTLDLDHAVFVRELWSPRQALLVELLTQLPPQLVLLADDQQDVAQVDECGQGHKEDLQDPEAAVGQGEGVVVASVLAAKRDSVAVHFFLFISPDAVQTGGQDEEPEEEEDTQPDLPHHRGVGLHLLQQGGQERPVPHGALWLENGNMC